MIDDRQGRLIICEQGNLRVTRTEHNGSITVLADRSQGKRLNSPSDVVVRNDGASRVWATAWDDLHCFAPDGTLIGKLLLLESVSNLTFGGPKREHFSVTAPTSL